MPGDPATTLLGLDFDGTLSHVVDDPAEAYAHPDSLAALSRLGTRLGRIAIITGRPVDQALRLGGFRGRAGLDALVICGQYGAERWDAATDTRRAPERPAAVAALLERLPDLLAEHDASHVRIEDKVLAVAVHTRGISDSLLAELDAPLRELAADLGLHVEPGRQVLEMRGVRSDKGESLRTMAQESGARTVVYAGDDLGDLPAFEEVERLRADGLTGLLVASASDEEDALTERADAVLDGPDAVAAWLTAWADALEA